MSNASDCPSAEELEELHELLQETGESDDTIENVLKVAALDMDRYEQFREMFQLKKVRDHPVTPPYGGPYEAYNGEIMLGTDPEDRLVAVTRQQLNEHMLVVGRTGAGKTTFFYNMIDRCNTAGLPVMVFDFKNDYRHVAEDLDLTVVNWRDLKFNPLEPPPGVRPARWGEVMVDTWTHSMNLLYASRNHLIPKLQALYRLYSDEMEDGVYPSLYELQDLVDAEEIPYASPRFRYKERIVSRLSGMLAFSGEIFDCSSGHQFEDLLDRNVVFELQEPNQDVQTFAVEALLTWIFYYRDAQDHRQGLRHMVLFDEAKQVFDVQRQENPDIPHPPITTLMGRVREFGEGLVVADHEPSKLSDSLKANTRLKLWMSLGSGHDVDEMAETFGLEGDEVDFARELDRGEAVLSSAGKSPVPVDLPPYSVEKTTSEAEAREQSRPVLEQLSYRERVRPRLFKDAIGDFGTDSDDAETAEDSGPETAVGAVALQLLVSIVEDPFLSMSERYDVIDVGSGQGNEGRKSCSSSTSWRRSRWRRTGRVGTRSCWT
jgi:uncharacterized protein (DUF2249 family)